LENNLQNTQSFCFSYVFGSIFFSAQFQYCGLVWLRAETKRNCLGILFCGESICDYKVDANVGRSWQLFTFQGLYYSIFWLIFFSKIHLILYSVVPFGLILVLNSLLILKMRSRSLIYIKSFSLSNSSSRKSKRNSMNKTVIILTFLFILMTLPSACASYFFDQLFVSEHGRFIVALCDAISFSYHGLNFVVYFLTNRRFRRKLMNVSKSLSV
jgi:hypothetical protein